MDLHLKNKIALVAASSDGLGFASALILAQEGAKVILNGRDKARLNAAVSRLLALVPQADVLPVVADLKEHEDIKGLIDKTKQHFSGLDILITNAGGPPVGLFEGADDALWQQSFDLTLRSVVRLVQESLTLLKKSTAASILTVSSISLKQPICGLTFSNVFRPAVAGLTKTLSQELAAYAVRVNSILPGWTATERSKELIDKRAQDKQISFAEEEQEILRGIPLRRLGTPEEFAHAVAFLVSPAASYITGQMLGVDGGSYVGLF